MEDITKAELANGSGTLSEIDLAKDGLSKTVVPLELVSPDSEVKSGGSKPEDSESGRKNDALVPPTKLNLNLMREARDRLAPNRRS